MMMKNSYLAVVVGASLLLALGGTANAHNTRDGGGSGVGAPPSPPGFNSGGGHNGFESSTAPGESSTNPPEPKGWDQGLGSGAAWKSDGLSSGTPVDNLPSGLGKN
jgi:hypothetical protein